MKSKNFYLLFMAAFFYLFCLSCNTKTESVAVKDSTANVSQNKDSAVKPANPPDGFKHAYANVNGLKIHYVTGGSGEPLVLPAWFRSELVYVEQAVT